MDQNDLSTPLPVQGKPRARFPWKLFFLLVVATTVASLLVVPYALTLQSQSALQPTFQQIVVGQLINALFVYAPLIAVGLVVANRLGLGAPLLSAWLNRRPLPAGIGRKLLLALAVGLISGAAVLLVSAAFEPLVTAEMERLGVEIPSDVIPSAWHGFLASISAGIVEEVLLRLFLLSLLAWLLQWVTRRATAGKPSMAVLWAANLAAALIFGALHLPNATALNLPLSALIVTQIIGLNSIIGLAFGWLYWTFGLEAAMLAHFAADIVLHVLAVLLIPPV